MPCMSELSVSLKAKQNKRDKKKAESGWEAVDVLPLDEQARGRLTGSETIGQPFSSLTRMG